MENNNYLYVYYKFISNLPYINPKYIINIYEKIKKECEKNDYNQFLKFLEYFNETYLHSYDKKIRNIIIV